MVSVPPDYESRIVEKLVCVTRMMQTEIVFDWKHRDESRFVAKIGKKIEKNRQIGRFYRDRAHDYGTDKSRFNRRFSSDFEHMGIVMVVQYMSVHEF
jgi:hypothetical protein